MNYLKFLSVLALLVGMLSSTVMAESQYKMYAYLVLGPVRTNAVSPDYDAFSRMVVSQLYTNRHLDDMDVGYRLLTEYITQPSQVPTNRTLHVVLRIMGVNGAKFSLNQVKITQKSSDPGNTLSNYYNFGEIPNLVYSSRAYGVTYGPGGERISDSVDISGPGNGMKDEICLFGMQGRNYRFNSPENYAQVANYVTNFIVNYFLTFKCEIVGQPEAFVQKTLQVNGMPMSPVLSVTLSPGVATVGVNMDTNRTIILSSKDRFNNSGTWTNEATLNSNELAHRQVSDPHRIYRARVQ